MRCLTTQLRSPALDSAADYVSEITCLHPRPAADACRGGTRWTIPVKTPAHREPRAAVTPRDLHFADPVLVHLSRAEYLVLALSPEYAGHSTFFPACPDAVHAAPAMPAAMPSQHNLRFTAILPGRILPPQVGAPRTAAPEVLVRARTRRGLTQAAMTQRKSSALRFRASA